MIPENQILCADALDGLRSLPDDSVSMCVTSPPYYGLRDYGVADQIGTEQTPAAYITRLVAVFREVRRVLRDDGTLWLNIADSYAGSGKGLSRRPVAELHTHRRNFVCEDRALDELRQIVVQVFQIVAFQHRNICVCRHDGTFMLRHGLPPSEYPHSRCAARRG